MAATGFSYDGSGAVTAVQTSEGEIEVEQVVVAVGPWIASLWEILGLPGRLDVRQPDGTRARRSADVDLLVLAGGRGLRRSGDVCDRRRPPIGVIHLDSDQPLRDDDGALITDEPWGIYFKPDRASIQGGAAPIRLGNSFTVDPYPTGSVDPGFPDMWCAALSHCLERFAGTRPLYRQVRSGGVGAFTADNFPVFDHMRTNVYVAADSNHGYKMIAVGREIARVLAGEESSLLRPFRYARFETGDLHPVSHSPYPWS